ncbi:MAG: cupin domain-containing protein [Acetobacteraceae bacterium]|nr:cupin domain-containing protein [Acetobacteraceae bacterium]
MIDLRDAGADPGGVIRVLGLQPHPEGGHYRETWRDVPPNGGRGAGTAILFLLQAGERSHWHRVDAAELWLWQGGSPLMLETERHPAICLGPDLAAGETLQGIVPAHGWQAARSLGRWTLCSCIVAPAFSFAGFEMADPGWTPAPAGRG